MLVGPGVKVRVGVSVTVKVRAGASVWVGVARPLCGAAVEDGEATGVAVFVCVGAGEGSLGVSPGPAVTSSVGRTRVGCPGRVGAGCPSGVILGSRGFG